MSSSFDTELLESHMDLEDSHDSDFGDDDDDDDDLEEASEEEEDEDEDEDEEEEDEDEDEEEAIDEPETPTGKDGQMIESYDKRELISAEEDIDIEPYEGMEFGSEDAAREFYNAYARNAGFRVRVSKCRRSMRDGSIVCRRFVCSREGFHVLKNQDSPKRQRALSRVGCMARLVVKKQSSGKWLVTQFEREHNHDPVPPRKVDIKPLMCLGVKRIENPVTKVESPGETEMILAPPRGNPNLEPYEGMEFPSEEVARTFYYTYAKDLGFTVRISKCRRARDGSIICRRFVCSKEGYYVRKYGRTKRSRALTRVGCLARLIVKKLDNGVWVVANFEKEHNHPPFVMGSELSYQPPKPTRRINRGVRAVSEAHGESMLNRSDIEIYNGQNSVSWRFNRLHQEGIKFAEEGASSVEIFNVAMFALREATQKVVAAKKNILCLPSVGSLNEPGQAPLTISLPNGRALESASEAQQLINTIPVSVQTQMSPTRQRLDGNGSLGSGTPAGRKRKQWIAENNVEDFDGTAAPPQGWNVVTGSNTGSGGNSTSVSLSGTQVAALQAVVDAFNVPTMGATSSSALPIKVSPVSADISEANRGYSPSLQEAPRTPGPNPLVHAAAIAAGARIASPAVAASLIKAVQSRTAVHIRSGSSSVPKLQVRGGGESFSAKSPGPQQPSFNIHYIQTGEPSLSLIHAGTAHVSSVSGNQELSVGSEACDLQMSIEQIDPVSGRLIGDRMLGLDMVGEDHNMIEQHHVEMSD